MGVRRQPHYRLSATAAALTLLFFATALGSRIVGVAQEEREETSRGHHHLGQEYWERVMLTRRRLGGPGSSPPTCRARCGRCYPCRPVHVPIPPGRSFPLEYYPEAWRCKCRNKLFMP